MTAHGVHRVLVVEGESLKGLVSALGVVRAVAEHGLGS
jgi:CBS domain-containing protein